MEWIRQWVQGIVVMVMVLSFIEMIMPRNSMKKYVDIVMGLALMAAILAPIGSMRELEILDSRARLGRIEAVRGPESRGYSREAIAAAQRITGYRLRSDIRALIGDLHRGETTVRVSVNDQGQVQRVDIGLDGLEATETGARIRSAIARRVADHLGISPDRVFVQ